MREIKFRAWSKVANMFLDITGFETEKGKIYGLFHDGDYIPCDEDIHLMQYTGLKDKNGKEIYEGDIVQISGHPFQGSIDIDGNYEVGYNELMELCCGGWYLHRMRHWAEVIGSIYENPELLKTK
ncbi:hypothetical protein COE40_19245 [Bacillus cereus]|nr:hypothetical protein COE40_19245 [Bacillus cereus]